MVQSAQAAQAAAQPTQAAPPAGRPAAAVIDLDLSEPGHPARASAWSRRRRRWLAALAVLMVTAATLTGSPPVRRLDPVFRLPDGVLTVSRGADLVIVVRDDPGGRRIEAYRQGDFSLAWRSRSDAPPVLNFVGDVLVLDELHPIGSAPEFQVLDTRTGRELWSRRGGRVLATAGDLMFVTEEPRADSARPGLVAIHARTGEVRWSRTPEGDFYLAPDGSGALARLVELRHDGRLTVSDLATAQPLWTTRIDVPPPPAAGAETTSWHRDVTLHGDLIVVNDASTTGARAFGLADGRPRWRTDRPVRYIVGCGRWLCEMAPFQTTVVDPVTGAARWQAPSPGTQLAPLGDRLVMDGGTPERPHLTVFDLRTGRSRALPSWHLASGAGLDHVVVVRRGAGQRALVAVLDARTGRPALVGTVTGWTRSPVGVSCGVDDRYLGCHAEGKLAVWRLPPH